MEPVRTCVGCRKRCAQAELTRLVLRDGQVVIDRSGRLPGRGAYIHPDRGCVELARKRRALPRALRAHGELDLGQLLAEVATIGDEGVIGDEPPMSARA